MIVRLLLAEGNPEDALRLQRSLEAAYPGRYSIVHAATLGEARAMLADNAFHAMLVDLNLPDSQGMHSIDALHAAAPALPLVAMTGLDDEDLAWEAIRRGAQDYLLKGQLDAALVARSIRYAVERKQVEEWLQRLLARMSHELRIPMCAIVDMTNRALSEQIPAKVRDYLQTARESANLLLKLLNDIFDFSPGETRRFQLEQIPFSLAHPLDRQETSLAERVNGNGKALGLKSSLFNIDEALARLGGQMGLFQEMVAFFARDRTTILTEIQAALRAGDAATIAQKAHRLKGTLLYLGAGPALEAIACVEAIGHSGDLTGAAEAIREMDTEMARLDEALRPYAPRLNR